MLNTFMKETSTRAMFASDIFGTVLGEANPFVKQEVFGWMGANLMENKPIAKEELTACLSVLLHPWRTDLETSEKPFKTPFLAL